ncbi:MAG: efflux RND transporter periplasmic adaptor subunit [Phycisphaerales bacterium]|nr:efflux RND transporter periplasmic adaptor subunit [Phycisphaerales bacterium]
MPKSRVLLPVVLLVVGFILLSGCDSSDTKQSAAPPPPTVTGVKALAENIPDYRYYPGITQAVLEADMVARVSGYLESRNFIEGDMVHAGQRLYLIQQEEYEADLVQAKANLLSAQAQEEFDRLTMMNVREAYAGGAATVYEVEEAQATLKEATAAVESNLAQVLNAELNLSYTEVLAPFDGRMGETAVDVGNLVSPTENSTLATLVMLDPMRVTFEPGGTELIEFLKAHEAGMVPVQITVQQQGGSPVIYDGSLDLVNNIVNQSTSTFLSRAVFGNAKQYVLPGLYVSVRVRLRTIDNAVMLPDSAMSSTPTSQYVYVVDSNQVLQRRTVKTGSLYEDLRQITSGLKAGDVVVVKGNPMEVRQGAKVKVNLVNARTWAQQEKESEKKAQSLSAGSSSSDSTSKSSQESSSDADSDGPSKNPPPTLHSESDDPS